MKTSPFYLPKALSSSAFTLCLLVLPEVARGYYIYGDPDPPYCSACDTGSCHISHGLSQTKGNLNEQLSVAIAGTAFGSAYPFSLSYNSYNADGSRAAVDTVMGFGWTHSFNIFLFSQRGHMFRYDGDGRVTMYKLGSGGTYTAAAGYFETLVRNSDGTFTLRQKSGSIFKFALVSGTPFLVGGPVYMLTSIADRNGNVTTLSYTSGLLTTITDTYGRVLKLFYNAQNKLTSVTDPLLRTTTFTYDPPGRQLLKVTDPLTHATQYGYNTLYQIVGKVDTDGRTYTYAYGTGKPTGKTDSMGAGILSLSNPGNWAVNETISAPSLQRTYTPATTTQTDGRGNQWKYDYDANGYITRKIAPDGATTVYTYDPGTLMMASQTDADGHTTSYQYDAQGNRTKMTDALGNVSTYTYEPTYNMMTSMTDSKSRVTTYEYDARGNRTKETDPLLQTRTWTYDAHGNMLTQTDKRGNTTTYTYDAAGNRTMIIAPAPLGYITRMIYDSVGNLLTRIDANLHTTTYQYDGLNRLIKETDPVGKFDQFEYDAQGNRTKVTDRNGHATTFQYDQRERLIKTTDAVGQTSIMSYDGNNNRTSLTDPNNHTTAYEYDVQNRPTKTTDAEFNVTRTVYDPTGNIVTQIDANAHATAYQYDALNRRTKMTDAESYVSTFQYDTGGSGGCTTCGTTPGSALVTQQADGNGKVTYFKYDNLDRLTGVVRKEGDTADVIDASDAVTSYAYDPNNNRLLLTEPNGNTTIYEYDVLNLRTKETNAAGDITRFAYDGIGNVVTTTAPNGNVTTTTYDMLDRVQQVRDSIGRVVSYAYDPVGNRLSQIDGNNNATDYTYDELNRLTVITDPLTRTTITQYDSVGNIVKTTDREGRGTTYLYDAINRRIRATDTLPAVTQYQYDAVGNLIHFTDANNHATLYTYDAVNRLIKEQYPDPAPNTRSYTYDAVNRISRTDQKTQTTTYTYNDLYFLLRRNYPASTADNMTYDLSGRMLTAERGGWLVTFTYDGANRITQTKQNGRTIAYAYDIPGHTRAVTYPGGWLITEQTDFRSRLSFINDAASPSPIVQYIYDLGNRVGTRTYRNGIVATYTYNANDWVLSLEHKLGATRIAGFGYDFDKEGNKKFEEKRHDTGRSESFAYDALYRLIDYRAGTLVGSTVPVPLTQTAYNLDLLANWNSKTTDGITEIRTHNEANEIIQIDSSPISHDNNGNLSADQNYQYAYDEENRLITVTRLSDSRVVGRYAYDALGRRIGKIADSELISSPVETRYFHDGARVVEEQETFGNTLVTYVYGTYVDELLLFEKAGTKYFVHANHLYSSVALTDITGLVVERYRYDAYGRRTVLNPAGTAIGASTVGFQVGFTGRYHDAESELSYFRARYLSHSLGRFIVRDPLGYMNGASLYEASFVPNKTDPAGLAAFTVTGVAKSFINLVLRPYGPVIDGTLLGIPFVILTNLGFNENPPSPATGTNDYRLYSMVKWKFECVCVNRDGTIDSSKPGDYLFNPRKNGFLSDTGTEPRLGGTLSLQSPPGVWLRNGFTRTSPSTGVIAWGFKGRPHPDVEPAIQQIAPRTSIFIWHDVEVNIECRGGLGFYSLKSFTGSSFPSHRVWLQGTVAGNIVQGPMSGLWTPHPADPTMVR